LRVEVLGAAIETAFHPRIILEKRLVHLSIASLKWYVLLHSDRRIMYKTSIIMAVAAILTVTVMTTLMEKQSYALQVGLQAGSGFDLVSHPGGHIDGNANRGSANGGDGGDANGGSACNFKCSASSRQ
jgi:hypothetical protein